MSLNVPWLNKENIEFFQRPLAFIFAVSGFDWEIKILGSQGE